jgi:hypothetical protein
MNDYVWILCQTSLTERRVAILAPCIAPIAGIFGATKALGQQFGRFL